MLRWSLLNATAFNGKSRWLQCSDWINEHILFGSYCLRSYMVFRSLFLSLFFLCVCHFFWLFRDSLERYWNTRHKTTAFVVAVVVVCMLYMCAAILTAEIKLALRYRNSSSFLALCYFFFWLSVTLNSIGKWPTGPTSSWTTRTSKEQQQIKSHKTQRTSNE